MGRIEVVAARMNTKREKAVTRATAIVARTLRRRTLSPIALNTAAVARGSQRRGLFFRDDIQNLRRCLDITQAQFARLMGAHLQTVSRWERGELKPTPYQEEIIEAFKDSALVTPNIRKKLSAAMKEESIVTALLVMLSARTS